MHAVVQAVIEIETPRSTPGDVAPMPEGHWVADPGITELVVAPWESGCDAYVREHLEYPLHTLNIHNCPKIGVPYSADVV